MDAASVIKTAKSKKWSQTSVRANWATAVTSEEGFLWALATQSHSRGFFYHRTAPLLPLCPRKRAPCQGRIAEKDNRKN